MRCFAAKLWQVVRATLAVALLLAFTSLITTAILVIIWHGGH